MNGFLFSDASDQLLLWALNVAIHATILTTLALVIASFLRRRAAIRYWVLCFGLMLVLASPGISALIQSSGRGWLTLQATVVPASAPPRSPQTQEAPASHAGSPRPALGPAVPPTASPPTDAHRDAEIDSLDNRPAASAANVKPAVPTDRATASQMPAGQMPASQPHRLVEFLRYGVLPIAAVWTIGSAFLLIRMLFGWSRMARILRAATPVQDPHLLAAFAGIYGNTSGMAAGRRLPLLVMSDRVSGPVAAGVFQGRVVLPRSLVQQVDAGALKDVLIHEVAHIVRHDQMVVLLQNLVAALYWPHPLMRVLNRELAKAREEVCDNFVLAATDAPAYSRTLLSLAQLVQPREAMPGSVGFFTSKWKLEERVAGLLDAGRDRSTLPSCRHWLLIAVAAIGLAAVTSVATLTLATASAESGPSERVEPTGLRGSVSGPDGKPIAAQIWLAGPPRSDGWKRSPMPVHWTKATTSNREGNFRVPSAILDQFAVDPSAIPLTIRLAATASGYGYTWADVPLDQLQASVDLRLAEDIQVRGRFVTTEGDPIQGVEVSVVDVTAPDVLPDSSTLLKTGTRGSGVYTNWPAWMGGSPTSAAVVTDADGRFELSGMGSERYLRLQARGSEIGATRLSVVTRQPPEDRPAGLIATRTGLAESKYFADFTHVAVPGRTIQGKIVDEATEQPIAKVRIVAPQSWDSRMRPAMTDASGAFQIHGVPKDAQYELELTPGGELGYFRREVTLQDSPSENVLPANLRLKRGTLLQGRVIDQTTGQGVDAIVEYNALFPNHNVDELGDPQIANPLATARTDTDGTFQIPVLPGLGAIGIRAENAGFASAFVVPQDARSHFQGVVMEAKPNALGQYTHFPTAAGGQSRGLMGVTEYNAFQLLNIGEDSARTSLELAIKPVSTRPGEIFDVDGNPLTGVEVIGLGPAWTTSTDDPLQTSKFTVLGLHPGESRTLLFLHRQRSLGASITVSGDQQPPIRVTMRPTGNVVGNFVDSLGDPLTTVELDELVPDELGLSGAGFWIPELKEDGSFRCQDLIEGIAYELRARIPGKLFSLPVADDIKAVPGRTTDVGTFRLNDAGRFEATAMAPAEPVASEQLPIANQDQTTPDANSKLPVEKLSGLITDSSGSAVADAMVAMIASNRSRDANALTTPLAQATTDSDGRFALNVPAISKDDYYRVSLIARKDDSAIAFESLGLGGFPESVTLMLKKAEPIRIRLVDLEGQPASDMPVFWRALMMRADNGNTARGVELINLSPRPSAAPPTLRTDATGWLTVPNVGTDQGVLLHIAGDQRFAPQSLWLNTGLPEKRSERDATYRPLVTHIPQGESATLPLAPAQSFSGRVLLGETNKPAANTRITIWSSQQQFGGSMYSKEGRTDSEGRFHLNPYPGVRYGIQVYPPDGSPYQPVQLRDLRWNSSVRTSNMTIRLPDGLVVRGRVIDGQTRQPIEDAYVQYIADANNPHDTDDFIDGWQTAKQTDAEGKFSVPALPAGGTIVVHAGKNEPYAVNMIGSRQMSLGLPGGSRNYAHAFLHVDLDEATSKAGEEVAIALSPSVPISVRLQDSKGTPVEGATYTTPIVSYYGSLTYRAFPETIAGSQVTLHGLQDGDRHQIHFWHSERRIGATAELTADNRDLLVTLRPAGSATMRLIDTESHPIADRPVSLQMLVTEGNSWAASVGLPNVFTADRDFQSNFDRELNGVPAITDGNGEVTLENLIPGVTYEFDYLINGAKGSRSFAVSPGQRLDVGDVMVDRPEES